MLRLGHPAPRSPLNQRAGDAFSTPEQERQVEIRRTEEGFAAYEGDRCIAKIMAREVPGDAMLITDLEGTGNPVAILKGFRALMEWADGRPVMLGVRLDNPKFSGLVKAYMRLGFRPEMLMMVKE